MEGGRPKRVKTTANHRSRTEFGSSSAHDEKDVGTRTILSFFKKLVSLSFRDVKRRIYKDGSYWSMISRRLFELDENLFMNVGGLSSNGYGIGDCAWVKETFDAGEQNTNHAQPTVNDLRFMYAVKNNVMINWPEEILKVMYSVSTSQSKLLPYSIFISRVVEYLHIDVSDTIIIEYTDKDHLVGESLIHKMGIYKYGNTWKYQEDHTTVDIELSSDEDQTGIEGQNATAQGEPSGSASQNMRNMVQSSVETQNRFIQTSIQSQSDLFSAEFQKLSMLIRGDQSLDVPDDAAYPPPSQS
ncbi:unnamed protein product [Lupinus luteus]|uniref:Uncharacterized protein n=1 Tax=Lupinus luteus TaxID=3873 RepID=A0AAV1WF82_LUPLU